MWSVITLAFDVKQGRSEGFKCHVPKHLSDALTFSSAMDSFSKFKIQPQNRKFGKLLLALAKHAGVTLDSRNPSDHASYVIALNACTSLFPGRAAMLLGPLAVSLAGSLLVSLSNPHHLAGFEQRVVATSEALQLQQNSEDSPVNRLYVARAPLPSPELVHEGLERRFPGDDLIAKEARRCATILHVCLNPSCQRGAKRARIASARGYSHEGLISARRGIEGFDCSDCGQALQTQKLVDGAGLYLVGVCAREALCLCPLCARIVDANDMCSRKLDGILVCKACQ